MQKPMSNVWFRLMALEYRIRSKPALIRRELDSAGVRDGTTVLDFGCGPGRYTLPAARLVGSGKVHAVDVHALATEMVKKSAREEGLSNVFVTNSDCSTGVNAESVDIALLYDTLHDVEDKAAVLKELHRVLKPAGRLSFKDHTLDSEALVPLMEENGFALASQAGALFSFKKR